MCQALSWALKIQKLADVPFSSQGTHMSGADASLHFNATHSVWVQPLHGTVVAGGSKMRKVEQWQAVLDMGG